MGELDQILESVSNGENVYVSSDITNPGDVHDVLSASLNADDYIILVFLPADADVTPQEVAEAISQATEGEFIVGVAVGYDTHGAAPRFEVGVADDLMSRADSITNAPRDTLTTYASLVHRYQQTEAGKQAMEEEQTTTTTTTPDDGGGFTPAMGFTGGGILIAVIVLVVLARKFLWKKDKDPSKIEIVENRRYSSAEVKALVKALEADHRIPRRQHAAWSKTMSNLEDIAANWRAVAKDAALSWEVLSIIGTYLPRTMALYDSIPEDMRTKPSKRGGSPEDAMANQIEVISKRVGEIRQAVYENNVRSLEAQHAFIKDRYREAETTLNFD